MTLTVEANGVKYTQFKQITVTTALDNLAWTFSFTTADNIIDSFPIKIGDGIKIFADGELILTGFAEKVKGSYDTKKHDIIVSGRSKTADIVDSTIDGSLQFDAQVNLATVAQTLIKNLFKDPLFPSSARIDTGIGLEETIVVEQDFARLNLIKVKVEADIDDFLTNESLSEDIGQTYFEVLEKFCRKRQVLMTTNGAGDLVFTRGRGDGKASFILQNKVGVEGNNIKSAEYEQDRSGMFYVYSCNSQPHRGGFFKLAQLPPNQLLVQNGRVVDKRIRPSRKLYFAPENSSDQRQNENRSLWEANIRASRSLYYRATVHGHSQNGATWKVNYPASVVDEKAGVEGNLLITNVTYGYTLTGGSISAITARPANSYTFPEQKLKAGDNLLNETVDAPLSEPGKLPFIFSETDTAADVLE